MEVENKLTIGLGLGTLAGLAGLMYWVLTQISPNTVTQPYTVEFQRPISGLTVNAKVTMRGVDVGRVGKIESRLDPERGFISVVQILLANPDVPLWTDGKPVVREVGNPALSERPGIAAGDILLGLTPLAADGTLGAMVRIADGAAARRALGAVSGSYVLTVDRLGMQRQLAFDAPLRLTFEDDSAEVSGVDPAAAAPQGVQARDTVVSIDGVEVASVSAAEQALIRLTGRLDAHTTTTMVVERDGKRLVVPITGREGPPMLTFWHRGTRASLSSNLVTGIKTVELSGDQPTGPAGPVSTGKLPVSGTIPADESDLFAELSELVRRRLPTLIHRADTLLAQVNQAGAEATAGLRDARALLKDARRWTDKGGDVDGMLSEIRGVIDDVRGWTKDGGEIDALLARANEIAAKDGDLDKLLRDTRTKIDELVATATSTLEKAEAQLAEGGDLAKTLANVEKLTGDGPDSTRSKIDKLIARLDGAVAEAETQLLAGGRLRKILDNLGHTLSRDIRQALNQVSESMVTFKQTLVQMQSNPDSIFLGKRSR